MTSFAQGRRSFGFCDRCGFRYNLRELKSETVNLVSTNLLVCPECWDPDHPQNMLGRVRADDPQALRNPRPLGGTSGRDLPAANRWTFESAVIETGTYPRINGWWATNGILTWNESSASMNLVSVPYAPDPVSPGDPYIWQGMGEYLGKDPDYLTIDSSIYKYVVAQFTVNRFPTIESDDRYKSDFQGELFWFPRPYTNPATGQQRATPQPYFPLSQVSDGFEQKNRDMASTFKIVFDMTNNAEWTGTIPIIRLDFFDARNEPGSGPDYDAGDIDIDYIEVVAFHNPEL
tara:strand:- start:1110 stop:1976 length:867 start_codon:yes stop_codon:yes gene_type:complete